MEDSTGILYRGEMIFTTYVTGNGIWRMSKFHDGCAPKPSFSLEYQPIR